jgi:hypothetical protein
LSTSSNPTSKTTATTTTASKPPPPVLKALLLSKNDEKKENYLLTSTSNDNNDVIQPSYVVDYYSKGTFATLMQDENILYLNGGDFEFFNLTCASTQTKKNFRSDFYYATAIELSFSYSVCNGNNSFFVVDYSLSNSFTSQCASINGFLIFLFIYHNYNYFFN